MDGNTAQEDLTLAAPGSRDTASVHAGEAFPAPVIIIGLGNPILGDDGVGWAVVQRLSERLNEEGDLPPCTIECLSLGGLSLMEHLIGYERAILVDAVNLGDDPIGQLYCLPLASLPEYGGSHTGSAHDTSLQQALKIGLTMGACLPTDIQVIGIQAENVYNFTDQLSEAVATAVPRAVELVLQVLVQGSRNSPSKE